MYTKLKKKQARLWVHSHSRVNRGQLGIFHCYLSMVRGWPSPTTVLCWMEPRKTPDFFQWKMTERPALTCTAQYTLGRHPSSVHLRELARKWSSSFKVISILWDPKPQPSCSSSEQHWRAISTPEVAMVLFCLSRECLPYPFMPSPSSFNSGHSHKHSLGYRLSIDLPIRVWVLKI